MNLPVRKLEEPLTAWKQIRVNVGSPDSFHADAWFTGVNAKVQEFKTPAHAECDTKLHDKPEVDCHCGFWCVKDIQNLWYPGQWDLWLAEVELYGKVIGYEKGYRAEKMRVLSITPTLVCGDGCMKTARFIVSLNGTIATRCEQHITEGTIISKEWLAKKLGTEIRGEFLLPGLPDLNQFEVKINQPPMPDIKFPDSITVNNPGSPLRIPQAMRKMLEIGVGQSAYQVIFSYGPDQITAIWRNMGDSIHLELRSASNYILWSGAFVCDLPNPSGFTG